MNRNKSACRIAMIMKFSTHSRHYMYLLCKPFLVANIKMRIDNYELRNVM